MAPGDLDGTELQRLLVDPEVDRAPDAPFGTAMLARMPLAFAFDLDPGAVNQQVQRPLGAEIRDIHGQGLLAPGQGAEIGHRPVEANQPKQALDEPGRLPERHAEQHLRGKAGLDGGIAVDLLPATSACRRGLPAHIGVEPDRQRASALERFTVGWPVLGPVGRGCRSAQASQLPRWIHEMNLRTGFVQQSPPQIGELLTHQKLLSFQLVRRLRELHEHSYSEGQGSH